MSLASEGPDSKSGTSNMFADTTHLSSTRPKMQFDGNSGIFYQGRSKTTFSTKNASELKCNLSKTGNRTCQYGFSKSSIYPFGKKASSHVYISDGLLCRDLAIRSLGSNPKLCQRQRTLCHARPRPRSLPTDLELESFLPVIGQQSNVFGREETVMTPSKEGYHPRSNSPTYRTLIETKEILVLELCKKLREIRRDLDGIKARKNSAVIIERPIPSETGDAFDVNDWYIKMYDVLQDGEFMVKEPLNVEDVDHGAGEPETLVFDNAIPEMRLNFSAEYLRAHINDHEIIGMNVEEVEKRIREIRNMELSKKKKVWDVPIGTPPELFSQRKTKSRKIAWKPKPKRRPKDLPVVLPQVKKTKFKVSKSNTKNDSPANYVLSPILVITENDLNNEEPIAKSVKKPEVIEHKQPQQTPTSPEINNNIESEVSTEKTPLIPEIIGHVKQFDNPKEKPTNRSGTGPASSVLKNDLNELSPLSQRLIGSSIKPKIIEDVVPQVAVEKKKPLTEKEKFLVMRKRMEERKAAQMKKKESYRDISMLGLRFDKQRERRGKLGNIISSKIDSMLAFGDDDEDEDDDDESIIDTDEELELKNLPA
ncbi:uncharacterized protein LOC117104954 isoform X3 [Anneissia japonica]|uniref:uncharacterized protein LOC117104954 isoform X3 n=1 Tax=Anneissia japonica TaxID=1529436 RepID=UPI0014257184|nr:uncharacterized protein LOC117104954 isoform X3 [Anneissia japonica]